MKRVIILIMFTLFLVCVYKTDAKALTGSGTSSSPYDVKTGSDLKTALSKGTSSWQYIAVSDTVAVTETITVSKGKFRIYAKGANRTIRRSQSMSASVNDADSPKRCIKLDGSTEMEVGYVATSYTLTINGSKEYFTNGRKCHEWFHVASNAKLTLAQKCIFKNAKNTMTSDEAAPIRNYGTVNLYGEIANCDGNNGGAIKSIGGNINVYSGSKVHGCKSGTEGGGIYARGGSVLTMNGGEIYDNEAKEEGGGIFVTGAVAYLYGGKIRDNVAGKTGGGVFTGNASSLIFGKNGTGPTVTGNFSYNSGGGIRCNGGSDISGGTSTFAGGIISENQTETSGGGISVGKPSEDCLSKISMANMTITYNIANNTGGGICFSEGVRGPYSTTVDIKDTIVSYNNSKTSGGGILLNTRAKMEHCTFRYNQSGEGGGVYITKNGCLQWPNGVIENNRATTGEGVYQNGIFELSESGYVNENNDVYLPKDKHIDITGKLTLSSILASKIRSAVKTKGTILVDVTYSGGTADDELYHTGSADGEVLGREVTKKFAEKSGCVLRPSTKNTQFNNSRYIIISGKYDIKYNSNSLDPVAGMPDNQIAFWKERIKLSENVVSRIGFILSVNKHWNLSADGTGEVLKPGADIMAESDMTLYAIWDEIPISSLTMTTVDRYYVVGQKITLDAEELLKKVKVENDLGTDVTYPVKVTKISVAGGTVIASGDDIKTENYIKTNNTGRFKLTLFSSNYDGTVTCTNTMNVYVLDDYYDKTEVRFVSAEFIETINPRSKWKKQNRSELEASLNNENNYVYIIDLEKEDLEEIRTNIKNNGYRINHSINSSLSNRVISN